MKKFTAVLRHMPAQFFSGNPGYFPIARRLKNIWNKLVTRFRKYQPEKCIVTNGSSWDYPSKSVNDI